MFEKFLEIPKCSICHEELRNNLVLSQSCGHVFHSECMNIQIQVNQSCPLCRKKIQKLSNPILYELLENTSVDVSEIFTNHTIRQDETARNLFLQQEAKIIKLTSQLNDKESELNHNKELFNKVCAGLKSKSIQYDLSTTREFDLGVKYKNLCEENNTIR